MMVIRIGHKGDMYFAGHQLVSGFEIKKVFYSYNKALNYVEKYNEEKYQRD